MTSAVSQSNDNLSFRLLRETVKAADGLVAIIYKHLLKIDSKSM